MTVKREQTSSDFDCDSAEEDALDTKEDVTKSKAGQPSTPKKAKTKSTPAASPGKKTGAWSKDELEALYAVMCPKRTGVKWDEVAAAIPGRDNKACQNKWTRMQSKIKEAIRDLGE